MSKNVSTRISENQKHPKHDFQVDRIAFFSDAVFAIVITLLVIELKVPKITASSTVDSVLKDLYDLKFNFIAIIISFIVVAQQWMLHHFLFKFIHDYNKKIIVASLAILLPIIFFPFSMQFFAESTGNSEVVILGIRLFLLNTLLANISSLIFYWIIFVRNQAKTYIMENEEKIEFIANTVFPILLSSIAILISFFT